ncbi:excalibur calcium-binding domain-containing protein, partial [Staphylococcus aureus]|uniref:excalibur calcium-binding domain-containing protein n=1 Tax=Staphylococcus aureus TaxID=1280 RepID=UPI00210DE986
MEKGKTTYQFASAPKDETKSTESNTNQDTNTTKDVIALKDVKTSPEDAVQKAEETYKGQKLKGISFENSNGEWAYKVTQQSFANCKQLRQVYPNGVTADHPAYRPHLDRDKD